MKMKMKMMFCLLLATIPLAPASANQSDDTSLMRSTDIAYEEAMKFAQLLREHGFTVRSVHRSKMEGFFSGLPKAHSRNGPVFATAAVGTSTLMVLF